MRDNVPGANRIDRFRRRDVLKAKKRLALGLAVSVVFIVLSAWSQKQKEELDSLMVFGNGFMLGVKEPKASERVTPPIPRSGFSSKAISPNTWAT
jgi:hypothetical protein